MTYCWPASLVVPSSVWLSWANLDFWCGELRQPGEDDVSRMVRSIDRVIAGRKPMGGDWDYGLRKWTIEAAIEALAALDPHQVDLILDVERRARTAGLRVERVGPYVLAAQDRSFGQLFELEPIARTYETITPIRGRHQSPAPSPAEFADFIRSLADIPIYASWELDGFEDWQRATANVGISATGLALGYPIESTLTMIWPWSEARSKS